MIEPTPDDRIEAVVGLVLQAVDQRLATVRDQMVQINNSVIHSHNQLQAQIDECRELCVRAVQTAESGGGGGHDAAAQQLMDVANALSQHVATFETRVNQYTNERVAELRSTVDRLLAQPAQAPQPTPSRPTPIISSPVVDDVAPAVARLGSLSSTPSRSTTINAPAATALAAATSLSAASFAPIQASNGATARPAQVISGQIDFEQLSAQMSARLSAVIDRALAE